VSDVPLRLGRADAAYPLAHRLALSEIADGQGWVSTRLHRPARIDAIGRRLLTMCDGTSGRAAIASHLGDVFPGKYGDPGTFDLVDQAIARLARMGLLDPAA
jgi:hypothetical protein